MTDARARDRLAAVPDPQLDTEHASPHDAVQGGRSSWPGTRLAAATSTLLLALAMIGPSVAHDRNAALWPALLLPGALATLAGRLVFESVDGSLAARGLRVHLLAAVAGGLVATGFMAASTVVLGLDATPLVELLTAALAVLVSLGAGIARDLEVRLRLALRRVYFAGSSESLGELRAELTRNQEASLVGSAIAQPSLAGETLTHVVLEARATVLVLDSSAAHTASIVSAAAELTNRGVHVRDLLTYYESEFKKVPLTELTPAWFHFERDDHGAETLINAGRRVFTVALASVLLLLSLPLIGILMLAVRLTSPGPAIFRQPRVGKDGSQFTLVKLRTMTDANENTSSGARAAWATDEAHRITPLGRLLRRYRLDELPQLCNVIRGDLALIGPRPEQVPIVERLEAAIPYYNARHTIRPGLTGWAQVNLGYAGTLEGARAKLQRDLYYVKHRGLRLDLLVLWLTLKAVFTDPR
jgi:lipopolysaccharide/colanic/teichoic acid biosynthesis glycosyltransferase